MQRTTVDFSSISSFPSIFLDYLSDKEPLKLFYKYNNNISSFKKIIEDKSEEVINRKILVEALREQNPKLKSQNKKTAENIELLLSDKTFTITTGHQLCIFTGPLYSIYKILSVIRLSQELKKNYPDYNFVPVFWMAAEDHDFEEISYVNIFGRKLQWDGSSQPLAGKTATGRLDCKGLDALLDELKGMLGENENASYLLNLFKDAYSSDNLADATRKIIHALFGKYGLVIIDGDDKRLKGIFTDIMREELLEGSSFKYVNETISKLGSHYKPQVNPREINLFYLDEEGRSRIVKEDTGIYSVLNTGKRFTEKEIIAELVSHPERFSPNVVLRPLYQEKILPNLAYVGGPGEISYWLEYKTMFEHFKVNFPLLASRNCALWLDETSLSKIEKLSIAPEDIVAETDALIKIFLERNFDHTFSLESEAAQTEKLFTAIAEKAAAIDITLKNTVEAEKQKQLNILKGIEDKITRAQKKKNETSVNQVRKLKERLFPEAMLQERYENFMPYYIKYGDQYFEMLLENFDALPSHFIILSE